MGALLGVVVPRVAPRADLEEARERLDAADGGHDSPAPAATRMRTLAGWADAAAYTISDLTMLRRELVIGFVLAGFADVAVPISFWRSLFVTGHGVWSLLENVALGPFLAVISFVCSIGNVPLAAALWAGGIGFGGVVAFVFADLITIPLLLIYRKYFGTRITLRLLAVFWATMSVSGLAVDRLFAVLHWLPAHRSAALDVAHRSVLGWNATTVLDVLALVVFGLL